MRFKTMILILMLAAGCVIATAADDGTNPICPTCPPSNICYDWCFPWIMCQVPCPPLPQTSANSAPKAPARNTDIDANSDRQWQRQSWSK